MGVKHLWSILQPYCNRKSLSELQGQIIAVDLAGWVCENMNVVDYFVQPKLYLRNLFFRVCYLLQNDIIPIFVLEGETPTLKYDVIAKRNEMQFCGAKPKETNERDTVQAKGNKGRTRFNHVLKQCADLVDAMGLKCVQAPGEAEAYCSVLNRDGYVDGILSQDSDCFAYGAKRVYRNFTISQGGPSSQGAFVDIYDIDEIKKSIDIGQNKIIVLALLCGCDYCPGVDGIGKDTVMKLYKEYTDDEILDRIRKWRENNDHYNELEMRVDNKNMCSSCGHLGKVQSHTKSGCPTCRTHRGCDASLWKDQRLAIKSELLIRKKALIDPNFPSKAIFDEFVNQSVPITKLNTSWGQPKLVKFLKSKTNLLQWNEIYGFQKFLPLLTRWQLMREVHVDVQQITEHVKPSIITKKRVVKGVACYEIIWDPKNAVFKDLISQDEIQKWLEDNKNDLNALYTTVEPQTLVDKMYVELVADFIKRTTKPAKPTRKKKREQVDGNINNTPRQRKKSKNKNKENMGDDKNQLKISDFVSKAVVKSRTEILEVSLIDDFNESEFNMSDIIKNIIGKSPTIKTFGGKHLRYDNLKSSSPLHHPAALKLDNEENILEISMNNLSLEEPVKLDKVKKEIPLKQRIFRKTLEKRFNENSILTLSDSLENIRLTCTREEVEINDDPDKTEEASAINIDDSFGLVDYVPITKDFKKRLF